MKIEEVTIAPPNFMTIALLLRGTAPYCQHRFSSRKRDPIQRQQEQGPTAKTKKKREARDFEADYKAAQHVSTEGWLGLPCPAFRNAMISACRTVQFVMTKAKLGFFIESDGIDNDDSSPLVKITKGEPRMHIAAVRNETGVIDPPED